MVCVCVCVHGAGCYIDNYNHDNMLFDFIILLEAVGIAIELEQTNKVLYWIDGMKR